MRRREFLAAMPVAAAVSGLTAGHAGSAEEKGKVAAPATIAEPSRETPITHEADVVIVGAATGGLGGCMAAIAAARAGSKTLLIEESGTVAAHTPMGLGVVIGVPNWRPSIREGLFRDFAAAIVKTGQHGHAPMTLDELLARGEIIVRYADVVSAAVLKMLEDAGVRMLFHARSVAAPTTGGRIRAIIVESPSGRHAVAGKVFIDSTATGDIAALAGAPMRREEAFEGMQALIAGVDDAKYNAWVSQNNEPLDASYRPWLESRVGTFEKLAYPWQKWWSQYAGMRMPPAVVRKVRAAEESGRLRLLYRRGDGVLAIVEGIKSNSGFALPRTYITGLDPLNADDVSWAETTSRLALAEFYRFLRDDIPGFERAVLERLAETVGLRGGRYIELENPLAREEIERGAKNEDCIHLLQAGPNRKAFEVPFRALVPQKIDNLLVVGKATGGGIHLRAANSVLLQGQAAGTAAAISLAQDATPRRISIRKLQDALKSAGVEIPY